MPAANEALGGITGSLQPILDAVVDRLGITVTFTLYNRVALSSDGSVFWVNTNNTVDAVGSLHYAVDRNQDDDQTIGTTSIIFSSETQVTEFNRVSPTTMLIGSYTGPESDSPPIQFAFSQRGRYHDDAQIWHYSGMAVYPIFAAQILDDISDLPDGPIVSNSLPLWLAMTTFGPVYPWKLVPENIAPPYIVAKVLEESTLPLQNFPIFTWPGTVESGTGASPFNLVNSSQQMRDEVELTFFGFTALTAGQYLASLIDASLNDDTFGFGSNPVLRDSRWHQVEIAAVAQKKTLHFVANYNLNTANATALRLILEAGFSSFTVESL